MAMAEWEDEIGERVVFFVSISSLLLSSSSAVATQTLLLILAGGFGYHEGDVWSIASL